MSEFFKTVMGRAFYEGTMPRLVKALESIAKSLEKQTNPVRVVDAPEQMKAMVLVGNLSEGFVAYGPYDSFDEACEAHDGEESWVMTLEPCKRRSSGMPIRPIRRWAHLEAEDECPNCKNGTLEQGEGELICRGECGAIFPTA